MNTREIDRLAERCIECVTRRMGILAGDMLVSLDPTPPERLYFLRTGQVEPEIVLSQLDSTLCEAPSGLLLAGKQATDLLPELTRSQILEQMGLFPQALTSTLEHLVILPRHANDIETGLFLTSELLHGERRYKSIRFEELLFGGLYQASLCLPYISSERLEEALRLPDEPAEILPFLPAKPLH